MKILTAKQTRLAEEIAFKSGMSGERLMENAGAAAAKVIKDRFEVYGKLVTVIAGQGNNGGDGFVVARKLKEYGARVTVILAMGISLTPDSNLMLKRAKQSGASVVNFYDDTDFSNNIIANADFIIDAVFGIGFHGAADREISEIFSLVNKSSAKKIALDLPSGVCCDDGSVKGMAVKSDITVSFIGYKPCHFLFPAADYCGEKVAVSIGIDDDRITDFYAEVTQIDSALKMLKPIPSSAHKGDKGKALIVGGSFGMAGAPAFSARAALRSGAGLVYVCIPKSAYPVAASYIPEAVFIPADEGDGRFAPNSVKRSAVKNADAIVLGVGMGVNDATISVAYDVISSADSPIVLDADGLNAVALEPDILNHRKSDIIVTPHPAEMARLLNKTTEEVQANRIACAKECAKKYGVITVLKGAYTVIADPNGKLFINTTGSPALATAGSGDMLSGMIAAFLANKIQPIKAAVAAVCLHGAVGEKAANDLGVRGVLTSDLIERLPLILN